MCVKPRKGEHLHTTIFPMTVLFRARASIHMVAITGKPQKNLRGLQRLMRLKVA